MILTAASGLINNCTIGRAIDEACLARKQEGNERDNFLRFSKTLHRVWLDELPANRFPIITGHLPLQL